MSYTHSTAVKCACAVIYGTLELVYAIVYIICRSNNEKKYKVVCSAAGFWKIRNISLISHWCVMFWPSASTGTQCRLHGGRGVEVITWLNWYKCVAEHQFHASEPSATEILWNLIIEKTCWLLTDVRSYYRLFSHFYRVFTSLFITHLLSDVPYFKYRTKNNKN